MVGRTIVFVFLVGEGRRKDADLGREVERGVGNDWSLLQFVHHGS